jgi:phospholipid-binding lipoprotein MlaA
MLSKLFFFLTFIFFVSPVFASTVEDAEFEAYDVDESSQQIYDPYEKLNRKIYAFNDAFDRYFFEHVARAYRKTLPESARDGLHNFLNNLYLPIAVLNSLAQGKTDNALATFSNFLINSTIGLGGFVDVANKKGVFYKSEDFGQTMGHYGFGPGAYIFLPFLGPSSTRDFAGFALDRAVSPAGFNVFRFGGERADISLGYVAGYVTLSGIDTRESLLDVIDDIRKDSFDPYATIRSAYLQKRINEIKN